MEELKFIINTYLNYLKAANITIIYTDSQKTSRYNTNSLD